MPGYVTVIRVRWAPQDQPVSGLSAPIPGLNTFTFDPTKGPGYVWHCHIVDHEDNEMMRPYKVANSPNPILQVRVYDMDKNGEFQVRVNGNLVFSSPKDWTKNNRWTVMNLDISPYVTSGTNVVVLRNPTWNWCRIDDVRIIIDGTNVVYSPVARNLQHTSRYYVFKLL